MKRRGEPQGCEFLLVRDDGKFSEFDTTLVSDWTSRTPREVLAKNWGVPEPALAGMPTEEPYIFQTSAAWTARGRVENNHLVPA